MDLPSAMPFPFGKSQKSPAEIVKALRENVAHLEKLDAGDSKKFEKVSSVACPEIEKKNGLLSISRMVFIFLCLCKHTGDRGGVQKLGVSEGDTQRDG